VPYAQIKRVPLIHFTPTVQAQNLEPTILITNGFQQKQKIIVINNDGKTDLGANIRAKKDSAIWISISPALGIEVARVMMTHDSIRVIDRINKKYYSYDYYVFSQFTSIPIDLKTLQNIIAGIPIYFDDKKVKTNRQDTLVMLTSGQMKVRNTLYLNPDYTLWRMDLIDSTMGKSLKLRYRNYNRDNKQPFAQDREMELGDEKKTNIIINFSRVKVDEPQKMPFNVKEKYE
jgi:hypothetical protein